MSKSVYTNFNNEYLAYFPDKDEYKIYENVYDWKGFKYAMSIYYSPEGNTLDDYKIALKKYYDDLVLESEQLLRSEVFTEPINYLNYKSHNYAMECQFKKLCKNYKNIIERQPDTIELRWIQENHNSGHVYINNDYLNKEFKGYGYDYSSYYPWLMTMVDIPIKKGKEYILKNIGDIDLEKIGFYRIDIKYTNKNLEKIFTFNKVRVYMNYQVKQLMQLPFLYKNWFKNGDVQIELIDDGEPNAYI